MSLIGFVFAVVRKIIGHQVTEDVSSKPLSEPVICVSKEKLLISILWQIIFVCLVFPSKRVNIVQEFLDTPYDKLGR